MEELKQSYYKYLRYFLAKDNSTATIYDKYLALAYAVRSAMVDDWIKTIQDYYQTKPRRVYFLSMEYIFGRSLQHNIINLGIEQQVYDLARECNICIEELYEVEESFDLGNGGKARLAACLLDSIVSLGIPAMAYGLRYEYGQFKQEIVDGMQIEKPYDWLHKGHPWEIIRPEYSCSVYFNGSAERTNKPENPLSGIWKDFDTVIAVPYDYPITGYKNKTVNTLRLWYSQATEEFLSTYINHGDYLRACEEKMRFGKITSILFPEEDVLRATDLRLKQQYFLVSASIYDILRRYKITHKNLLELGDNIVIHLNGSSCAIAICELMRQLVDIENIPFDTAWNISKKVFSYTSNAIVKEMLESWPVYLLNQILPRHMQIIYDINQKHLDEIRGKYGSDDNFIRELSLIAEGEVKRVKFGNLAVLFSYSVNGVSTQQTETLKKNVFPEFMRISPEKFCSQTNGASHRRWLLCANRKLGDLISSVIGDGWIKDAEELSKLKDSINDTNFVDKVIKIHNDSKRNLADYIKKETGLEVDISWLFDVQCKKIHQYKRQVLNIFNVIWKYLKIKNGEIPKVNRVHIFSGKAGPSDNMAKQIVRLINITAKIINNDSDANKYLKVVFLPNYNVSLAEKIIPGSDISEQIATPGQEASGTGNSKFLINGSHLIASKSGSNLEIIQRVGSENIFVFGRSAEELPPYNNYHPYDLILSNNALKSVFEFLQSKAETVYNGGLSIRPLLSTIMDTDRYYVLLDFDDYMAKQEKVDELYSNIYKWTQKGIENIAKCSYFSIDRTIQEYARTIWKVTS